MIGFIGITSIFWFCVWIFSLVLEAKNPVALFPMGLAASLSYAVLIPPYLMWHWLRFYSREKAIRFFYGTYLYRFLMCFVLIEGLRHFLEVVLAVFLPFLIFFYLMLLFLEAGWVSYQLGHED